eukprot:TRINITY_DN34978_c0_g1_i4.p1 TRINITY_DN34978_c0_g1~~TRINITY_DN34978_c0_g1_i4.p1  ORF type:complete len:380 (+),score=65.85 TRINITY_DN34978_c0_g1_i4:118-1257(+)
MSSSCFGGLLTVIDTNDNNDIAITTSMPYFQLLAGHHQWCAVKSGDNGNAHFVAKGVAPYIAETEYSPLTKYIGEKPCIETAANKALFEDLPTIPAEEMIHQPGTWHKPSGATAMLPVDFALQYSNETYIHVLTWAFDASQFFKDFQAAWLKMTELGQELRCPNVNGASDFNYSRACAERFGADEAAYRTTWDEIRGDIKALFDASPSRCKSIRPKQQQAGESSVCPPSVLRLGFHICATYDPTASGGNVGGSNFANFLGACAMYDGCAGCLQETQRALQRIQQRYADRHVSLADVTIYAAGLAAAYLAEFKLNHMPFHPGRLDAEIGDSKSTCRELGARLPSPAYQWKRREGDAAFDGMLIGDLVLPTEAESAGSILV